MHLVGLYTYCRMMHGAYNVKSSSYIWSIIQHYIWHPVVHFFYMSQQILHKVLSKSTAQVPPPRTEICSGCQEIPCHLRNPVVHYSFHMTQHRTPC